MAAKGNLAGQVALVAGATRGAGRGIARALGEAGAFVYCTGRSAAGYPKGMDRPETLNETVAMIERAAAVRVDHTRVEELSTISSNRLWRAWPMGWRWSWCARA